MKNISEYINECVEMPVMIQEKLALKKNVQVGLIDANREEILGAFIDTNAKEVKKRRFVWIPPKNAQDVVDQYEGRGWTTATPLKAEDKQKMIDLITNNGGWYFTFQAESYYNKSYNKFIVSIIEQDGKHIAVVMAGYSGCWTMSGEDYVAGRYTIKEIPLAGAEENADAE
jgi:hypothetical protein